MRCIIVIQFSLSHRPIQYSLPHPQLSKEIHGLIIFLSFYDEYKCFWNILNFVEKGCFQIWLEQKLTDSAFFEKYNKSKKNQITWYIDLNSFPHVLIM